MLEKTLLVKTLRSALESYKFQFNSMTTCSQGCILILRIAISL